MVSEIRGFPAVVHLHLACFASDLAFLQDFTVLVLFRYEISHTSIVRFAGATVKASGIQKKGSCGVKRRYANAKIVLRFSELILELSTENQFELKNLFTFFFKPWVSISSRKKQSYEAILS